MFYLGYCCYLVCEVGMGGFCGFVFLLLFLKKEGKVLRNKYLFDMFVVKWSLIIFFIMICFELNMIVNIFLGDDMILK